MVNLDTVFEMSPVSWLIDGSDSKSEWQGSVVRFRILSQLKPGRYMLFDMLNYVGTFETIDEAKMNAHDRVMHELR